MIITKIETVNIFISYSQQKQYIKTLRYNALIIYAYINSFIYCLYYKHKH